MKIEATYLVQLDGVDHEEIMRAVDRIEAVLLFHQNELHRLKTNAVPPVQTIKNKREHVETLLSRWQQALSLARDWTSLPIEGNADYGRRWTELRLHDELFRSYTEAWPGIDEPDDPFAELEF